MATTYTENYNFGKQENYSDTFQMNVITANFDSLDTILKSMSDEIQALKDRVTALENA